MAAFSIGNTTCNCVNVFRLTVTAIIARFVGPDTAQGFLHDLSGMVVFVIAFVLLYLFQVLLSRFEERLVGRREYIETVATDGLQAALSRERGDRR